VEGELEKYKQGCKQREAHIKQWRERADKHKGDKKAIGAKLRKQKRRATTTEQSLADSERDKMEMAKLLKLHIEVAARTAEIAPEIFEGYDTAAQILDKDRGTSPKWCPRKNQQPSEKE
jgi:hypothetical protein